MCTYAASEVSDSSLCDGILVKWSGSVVAAMWTLPTFRLPWAALSVHDPVMM
jgi:hypothetical protein